MPGIVAPLTLVGGGGIVAPLTFFADVTPPVYTAGAIITNIGTGGFTAGFTTDENAVNFAVAVPQGSLAPTPAEIVAGVDYRGVDVLATFTVNSLAGVPTVGVISGIVGYAGQQVYIYIVARDSAGNLQLQAAILSTSVTLTPIVIPDTTPPVITLSGANPLILVQGNSYIEPGYTAVDNIDGIITQNVQITGSVNTAVPGQYALTYSVRDAALNLAQVVRTVVIQAPVLDTVAPALTLLGANPLTLQQGVAYVEPGYTAVDLVDGVLTGSVQVTGSVDHTTLGPYTLTYVVADAAGNQASAVRIVNVVAAVSTTIPTIAGIDAVVSGDDYSKVWQLLSKTTGLPVDVSGAIITAGIVNSRHDILYTGEVIQTEDGNWTQGIVRIVLPKSATAQITWPLAGKMVLEIDVFKDGLHSTWFQEVDYFPGKIA